MPQSAALPPAADAEAILACEGLSKSFRTRRGEVRVLDGVDLCVRTGEVVVISGKSGEGKSTLLNLLAGLEAPTSGCVKFCGRDLDAMTARERALLRRSRMGMIFQSFNLLPAWTAFENVEAALLTHDMPKGERRDKVEAGLREVGLAERMDMLPAELSVGQQQRVAVARTLAMAPDLVLADEPTGDVDPETGREIMALLRDHAEGDGRAMLIATHGDFPTQDVDAILRLEGGKLTRVA